MLIILAFTILLSIVPVSMNDPSFAFPNDRKYCIYDHIFLDVYSYDELAHYSTKIRLASYEPAMLQEQIINISLNSIT